MQDQGANPVDSALERALALLGLLPLLAVAWLRPDALPWLAWGAGLWALGLLGKLFLLGPIYASIGRILAGERGRAAVWGCCSALAELGLSLAFLIRFPRAQALEIGLWLGLGTGLIEIAYLILMQAVMARWPELFVTGTSAAEDPSLEPERRPSPELPAPVAAPAAAPPPDAFVRWSPLLERSYTLIGHICSRGLLGIGLKLGLAWPIWAAGLIFAAVDGFASYAQARRWNFSEPATARRFHGSLAAAGLAEALLLYLLWRGAS